MKNELPKGKKIKRFQVMYVLFGGLEVSIVALMSL
jgi:hypothetical protein